MTLPGGGPLQEGSGQAPTGLHWAGCEGAPIEILGVQWKGTEASKGARQGSCRGRVGRKGPWRRGEGE